MKRLQDKKQRFPLTVQVYVICAALALLFAASNLRLLDVAGRHIDQHQVEVDRELVGHELGQLKVLAARDQAQISYWDDAVAALYNGVEVESFVRRDIADWLWDDFGIRTTIVVGHDHQVEIAVIEDTPVAAETLRADVDENLDLIRRAVSNFDDMKVPSGNGFTIENDPLDRSNPLYAADIRAHGGQPAIVVAQVIVPDKSAIVPAGTPKVLLTIKPVTDTILDQAKVLLGFEDLKIELVDADPVEKKPESMFLQGQPGAKSLMVTWTTPPDSGAMWQGMLPPLAAVFLIVVAGLGVIATRYAKIARELAVRDARNSYLALHDPLTGLANRTQFNAALETLVEDPNGKRWAVGCIDLDKFKLVNDNYGHQAGDEILRRAAEIIEQMVGDTGLVARVGGDEFVALFVEDADKERLRVLCETMIYRLSQDIHFENGKAQIGASIGVAWWPDAGSSAKEVLRAADNALYRAKESGRGTVCFTDDPDERRKGERRSKGGHAA